MLLQRVSLAEHTFRSIPQWEAPPPTLLHRNPPTAVTDSGNNHNMNEFFLRMMLVLPPGKQLAQTYR